jgi:tetratricopeptide (TPR) repeat protein
MIASTVEGTDMIRSRRPGVLILLLTGLLATMGPVTWADLPSEDIRWIQVDTPHFTAYSNSTDAKTAFVVQAFERFHAVLGQIFPDVTPDETLPTYIFVFMNTETYEPYDKRDDKGRPGGFAGSCVPGPIANYIVVDARPDSHYRSVVYHEYVHRFLNREFSSLPLWVHEGLAEYLSTFSYDEGEATLGDPLHEHLEMIRGARKVSPLGWTFGFTADSPSYSEAERAGPFYAYSWILVHYLMHDGNGRPLKPHELLALWQRDRPFERSLLERLGMSKGQLQVKLEEYARKKSLGFTSFALTTTESVTEIETSPASRASVLARLGELLAFGHGDYREAEIHLRGAFALDPDAPGVRAGLSYLFELRGESEVAAQLFANAVELRPDDAQLFFLRGKSLLDRYVRQVQAFPELAPTTAPEVAEARRMFEKSIALDPDLAEGYVGLGQTYIDDSVDPAPGIAALETAHRLLPARMDVESQLACLYARAGKLEQCDAILARIERRDTAPTEIRQARQAVLDTKQDLVNQMLAEKRLVEAIRILETMMPQAVDSDRVRSLQDQLERLRAHARTLERFDRYNRAAALTNEGKLDEAFDLLVELEPQVEDPELAAAVDSLLEYLRANLHKPDP